MTRTLLSLGFVLASALLVACGPGEGGNGGGGGGGFPFATAENTRSDDVLIGIRFFPYGALPDTSNLVNEVLFDPPIFAGQSRVVNLGIPEGNYDIEFLVARFCNGPLFSQDCELDSTPCLAATDPPIPFVAGDVYTLGITPTGVRLKREF